MKYPGLDVAESRLEVKDFRDGSLKTLDDSKSLVTQRHTVKPVRHELCSIDR